MKKYDHTKIEKKWQKQWEKDGLHETQDSVKGKENYYTLVEFPYPSGNLHIGHWYAFAVPDIFARFKRMAGYNVLFPIGFDAFGLPAENAAIKNKLDPKKWTYGNISRMTEQLKSIGASFDWSRQVITSDPDYYTWTQWLFLQLYKKGLAYRGVAVVNWDPKDMTVLANEQVLSDGTAERSGAIVEKRELTQWFLKITDYAERLLADLEDLKWPEEIKRAQREWIGRSDGAEISFPLVASASQKYAEQTQKVAEKIPRKSASSLRYSAVVNVFTTRPDTLFGATYLVISPEALQEKLRENNELRIENYEEVTRYIEQAKKKKELERMAEGKDKTGVELKGIKAINLANNKEIPIWVADYVLGGYGTGAIMAVPAHDERDFQFAQQMNADFTRTSHGLHADKIKIIPVVLANQEKSRSFIMGADAMTEANLQYIGVEVVEKTDKGFLKALIPFDRLEEYKKFIREKMTPGYWNEFSTKNGFYFIFKHKDGKIEEFELNEKTNDIIDKYGALFNDKEPDKTPQNVYSWLAENGFYKEMLIHTGEGMITNSGQFDGMRSGEAKDKITEFVGGTKKTTYKLRDWLISRQRYWGCPIPVVYDPMGNPHPVPEEHLPWLLPEDVDFTPTGEPPLASSEELKKRAEKLFGKGWRPEYDTMDTFVDSSWYYLAYIMRGISNFQFPISKYKKAFEQWMPVKCYSGGAEHTTVHLLYSRFFHKALFDLGIVTEKEPYEVRMNRGIILGTDGRKMSKRWGNVIDPDAQVKLVGADSVRMYLAFIGPYNIVGHYPWDTGGIAGTRRFLERVWALYEKVNTEDTKITPELETMMHQTIKKVSEDIEDFKFNTAVSSLMIYVNALYKVSAFSQKTYENLLLLLAPFAPHMTEEIWRGNLKHERSIHEEPWPVFDATKLFTEDITIVVQVNGKVRGELTAPRDTKEDEIKKMAQGLDKVSRFVQGKTIQKIIYVPGKIVSIVTD